MRYYSRKNAGFSLVELLVVVAIMGILSSIVVVALGSSKQKSRDSKRIADIKTIQIALSTYYANNGFYPRNIYAASNAVAGADPGNGLAPAYIAVVPTDPSGGTGGCSGTGANAAGTGCYRYNGYLTAGSTCNLTTPPYIYHLGAAFEDTSNNNLSQDVAGFTTISATQATFAGTTYTRCGNLTSPSSHFDGDASACVGTTAATPDSCYDVTP